MPAAENVQSFRYLGVEHRENMHKIAFLIKISVFEYFREKMWLNLVLRSGKQIRPVIIFI